MKQVSMKAAVLGGALLTLSSSVVLAEFSANVALTSNYVFRGITQTADGPALQGGFDYSHDSGIYAGVWGSNVSGYGPDNSMEIDMYLGWGTNFSGFDIDLGYLRYQYPQTDVNANNTDEFHIGGSYDFGAAAVGYTYNYSPKWFGPDSGQYHAFSVDVPLPSEFSLSGTYGLTRVTGADYEDYSIGVAKSFGGFDFGLTYTGTSGLSNNDDNFIFTVGKTF